MLTKNRHVLCVFLACAVGMVLGATVGSSSAWETLSPYPALSLHGSAPGGPFIRSVIPLCAPAVRQMLFLLACGFCAFSGVATALCAGIASYGMGYGFLLLREGIAPQTALLLGLTVLDCVSAIWLALRAFSLWCTVRDGHLCRLYPVKTAVYYRLVYQFVKIGICLLLVRIGLVGLSTLLPFC